MSLYTNLNKNTKFEVTIKVVTANSKENKRNILDKIL